MTMMTTMILVLLLIAPYGKYEALQLPESHIKEYLECRAALEQAQRVAKEQGKRLSPNSKVVTNYKKSLPVDLPPVVFLTLLGNMLGDASVKYNPSNNMAYIAFEWGNREYAYYIHGLMGPYVLSQPREQVRVNAAGNKVTTYCFQTVTLPCFAVFHHLFIVNGIKTVPVGLVYFLFSPIALATWYMDDGGLDTYLPGHGRTIHLHTHSFTIQTVTQMVVELNERYDLGCRVRVIKRKQGQPIIVIPSKSYSKFYNIVAPHIHSSMAYKLPKP